MKTISLLAALLAGNAIAFPHMDLLTGPLAANAHKKSIAAKRQSTTAPQGAGALPAVPPPFDAAAQHVSTTGQYKVRDIHLQFF